MVPEIDAWKPTEPAIKSQGRDRRPLLVLGASFVAVACGIACLSCYQKYQDDRAIPGITEAEFYIARDTKRSMKAEYEGFTIQSIAIEPVAKDPRKIPWLWIADVRATITQNGKPFPYHARDIYNYDPEGEGFGGLVRDSVSDAFDGGKFHFHAQASQWTREFLKKLVDATSQVYEEKFKRYGDRDHQDAQMFLKEQWRKLARDFEITDQELQDIFAGPAK